MEWIKWWPLFKSMKPRERRHFTISCSQPNFFGWINANRELTYSKVITVKGFFRYLSFNIPLPLLPDFHGFSLSFYLVAWPQIVDVVFLYMCSSLKVQTRFSAKPANCPKSAPSDEQVLAPLCLNKSVVHLLTPSVWIPETAVRYQRLFNCTKLALYRRTWYSVTAVTFNSSSASDFKPKLVALRQIHPLKIPFWGGAVSIVLPSPWNEMMTKYKSIL